MDSAEPAERRSARGGLRRLAIAFVGGAVAALGQAPFDLAVATVAGLAVAMLLLRSAAGGRAAAGLGWVFGVGYFALALSWIVEPFLVDVARHGWMAPFALILMAGGLALFWAAAFALTVWVVPDGRGRMVASIGALTLAEGARSVAFGGFPWAMIGHVWVETPVLQAAALVGPIGLTALTLALGAALASLVRRKPMGSMLLALPFGVVGLWGWWQAQQPLPTPSEALVVRLVQPNAVQREKWDPARAQTFFERQLAFTAAAAPPDVVVWPESALPYWLNQAEPELARIAEAARGATVLLGAQRVVGARAYNSLVVLGREGVREIYDKHHLVPFGEYIPLGQMTAWLGLQSFAAQDGYGFDAGPGPVVMDLEEAGRVLPLICYEAIFAEEVAAAPERPDWMVQITNDAWFGLFSGPYQHFAQARLRAVEQGLPLVRVANTGVSGVIDARGHVVARIRLGEDGWRDVALPAAAPETPYARSGDLPAWIVAGLLLFGAGLTPRRGGA